MTGLPAFRYLVVAVAREEFNPEPPPHALDRILARRAAGDVVILPTDDAMTRRVMVVRAHKRSVAVALVMLTAITGVAAALPGTPLYRWIARALAKTESVAPASSAAIPEATPVWAGVAVVLAQGEMWVTVDSTSPTVRIRVRLTNETTLDVRGFDEAAQAEFRPRAGGIGVIHAKGGELHVGVPRQVRRFVLRVDGVPFVVKEGDRLHMTASGATDGTELLFSIPR